MIQVARHRLRVPDIIVGYESARQSLKRSLRPYHVVSSQAEFNARIKSGIQHGSRTWIALISSLGCKVSHTALATILFILEFCMCMQFDVLAYGTSCRPACEAVVGSRR